MRASALKRKALRVMEAEQAREREERKAQGLDVEYPLLKTSVVAVATVIGFRVPIATHSSIGLVLAVERYFKTFYDPKHWRGAASG